MKNRKLIILIILAIAAFISIFYGITYSPGKRGGEKAAEPAILEERYASVEKLKGLTLLKRKSKRSDYIDWGRSPFLPKAAAAAKAALSLNGIMWDDNNPLAIIDNEIIGVGGKIGEYTVKNIKKDSVTLSGGAGDLELKLAQ